MDLLLVAVVALLVSTLTFFSGFGLGTLLLPAFALFMPVEWAVASTAVVHFANNVFKLALVGRHAEKKLLLMFVLPAAAFSFLGAALLVSISGLEPIHVYRLGEREYAITIIKLVVAVMMVLFVLFELAPGMNKISFPASLIPLGGALSGFAGGLSGHQGALRTAVLMRLGLSKEAFIGTGVVCAVAVDLVRLIVYGVSFFRVPLDGSASAGGFILAGTIAAFAGTLIGNRLLKKITLTSLHIFIGIMILFFAVAMGAGFI